MQHHRLHSISVSSFRNAASSSTATPNFSALSSLLPASATGHNVTGFLRYAVSDFGTECSETRLGLVAGHGRECAGQYEDLPGEWTGNGGMARHIRPVHTGLLQSGDDFAVVRLLEKGVNIGGHRRPMFGTCSSVSALADIKASRLPKCSQAFAP